MSIQFLVDTKQQNTQMTCVPTAIWMMHRWYIRKAGFPSLQPMFDAIVDVSKRQVEQQERTLNAERKSLTTGLNEHDISGFVRNHGLEADSIPTTSESFENLLRIHGPFVYVESVPDADLPLGLLLKKLNTGSQYSHALVITGVVRKHGFDYVYFNDPATGLSHHLEFTDFVRNKHKPMRGIGSAFVIYLPNKI